MLDFKQNIKELQSIPIDENRFLVQALAPRTKLPLSDYAKKNYWFDVSLCVTLEKSKNDIKDSTIRNYQKQMFNVD